MSWFLLNIAPHPNTWITIISSRFNSYILNSPCKESDDCYGYKKKNSVRKQATLNHPRTKQMLKVFVGWENPLSHTHIHTPGAESNKLA
jgi:hypothetical protein